MGGQGGYPQPMVRQQSAPEPRPHFGQQSQQPSYAGSDYGGQGGYPQQPVYGGGDAEYGFNDNASTYSHTALTMEKGEPEYLYSPPAIPYGAPSYPPSSPLHPPNPNSPFFADSQYAYQSQRENEYQQARQKLLNRRSVRQIELTDGHLVLEVPVPRSILQYNKYKGEDLSSESGKMRYTAVSALRFRPGSLHRVSSLNPYALPSRRPGRLYEVRARPPRPSRTGHAILTTSVPRRCRYRLRQTLNGRKTELMLILTMYNGAPRPVLIEKSPELTTPATQRTRSSSAAPSPPSSRFASSPRLIEILADPAIRQNIQYLQSRTKSKTWGEGSWKKCGAPLSRPA